MKTKILRKGNHNKLAKSHNGNIYIHLYTYAHTANRNIYAHQSIHITTRAPNQSIMINFYQICIFN